MSKTGLKKALAGMNREQIIEMVMELYAVRKDAREYLEFWLNPDTRKESEKRIEQIRKLFFTGERARKTPKSGDVNRIVKEFSLVCYNMDVLVDFFLQVGELYVEWMKLKGRRLTLKPGLDKLIREAEMAAAHPEVQMRFEGRIEDLRAKANAIWETEPSRVVRRGRFRRFRW